MSSSGGRVRFAWLTADLKEGRPRHLFASFIRSKVVTIAVQRSASPRRWVFISALSLAALSFPSQPRSLRQSGSAAEAIMKVID